MSKNSTAFDNHHDTVVVVVGLILLLFVQTAFAEGNIRKQMRVRAAFIFQMSKFINWPLDKSEPLVFCLFEDKRAYSELVVLRNLEAQGKLASQGHKVKTKVIVSDKAKDIEQYNNCSLIYFNHDADTRVSTAMITMLGKTKLIIGSNKKFVENGGLAALVYEKGKHKLYIHRKHYEASYLKIRSRLLSLAKFYPQ